MEINFLFLPFHLNIYLMHLLKPWTWRHRDRSYTWMNFASIRTITEHLCWIVTFSIIRNTSTASFGSSCILNWISSELAFCPAVKVSGLGLLDVPSCMNTPVIFTRSTRAQEWRSQSSLSPSACFKTRKLRIFTVFPSPSKMTFHTRAFELSQATAPRKAQQSSL